MVTLLACPQGDASQEFFVQFQTLHRLQLQITSLCFLSFFKPFWSKAKMVQRKTFSSHVQKGQWFEKLIFVLSATWLKAGGVGGTSVFGCASVLTSKQWSTACTTCAGRSFTPLQSAFCGGKEPFFIIIYFFKGLNVHGQSSLLKSFGKYYCTDSSQSRNIMHAMAQKWKNNNKRISSTTGLLNKLHIGWPGGNGLTKFLTFLSTISMS